MILRRITTSLLLLAFVGATIGLPVPRLVDKADEDFPCRYHACGCLDARMCRTNCCCFKPVKAASSCCQSVCRDSEREKTGEDSPDGGLTVTLSIDALKCKGLTAVRANLGMLYCSTAYPAVISELTVSDDTAVLHEHVRPLCSLEPPLPPPRT
ncbi:MAG: hypothetical protein MI923_13975 [Phycisphaerales bacterium]|nr:hypothetical protein [Phycisphaerales bacterium]